MSQTSSVSASRSLYPSTVPVTSPQATGELVYYGGPVIQNVNVIPIYYSASLNQAAITTFYSALVAPNTYFGLLAQYHTTSPKQTIGFGTVGTPYVSTTAPPATLTDAQIQTQLTTWISAGVVPAPTSANNNYYVIHFPSGVSISSGGTSCVDWCGYHGTFTLNGVYVFYGVIPDMSAASCSCWGSSKLLDNVFSVSSHELFETVTDAAVGVACCYAPPLGWYSQAKGEIGDICAWQQASVTLGDGKNYVVQKQWSDVAGACTTS